MLRVWLPLNGDLHNQGCTGYTITAVEASPTFTTGKIGQCYQRASTSSQVTNGLQIQDNLVSTFGTAASVAVWVKPLGTHTHYNGTILSSGNWNAKKWAFGVSQDNSKVDVLCGSYNNYITCAVPVNEWTHLVSTFDNGTCKLYKNGAYIGQLTGQAAFVSDATWTGIGRETYAGGYFGFNGCINDLRIYDHCLSPAEVKEISQGLVLHYKLDSIDIKTGTNLVTGITKGGHTTLLTDGRIGVETSGVNADTYFAINLSESIVAGTSYFLSCDASGISTGQYWGFPLGQQNNSTLPFKIYNGHNEYAFTANDTLPNGNAMNWGTNRLFMDDNSRSDWANKAQFYNFQLVKISAGTELMVEDSSGYNHNGTITGDIQITPNSSRHSNSIYIPSGNTDYITTNNEIGNFSEGITTSIWFKSSNKSPGNSYHELFNIATATQNFEHAVHANGYFRGGMVINGTRYVANTNNNNLTDGNWHHIAMTYDGSTLRRYVDGVDKSDTTVSGTLTSTSCKFLFGHYGTNTSYYAKEAYLSDARIYCTALDADAIRQLYQVGAKIDNKQNWHTFEFIEGTNGNTKITKSGQTVVQGNLVDNQYYNGLIEDGDKVKINSNKTITAAEFIEA